MLVEIKEGSMLGPFFSRYVKEHCGENSMWPVAKKMLLLSASIGASIRKHCSMSIAPADLAGATPIFTRRRIRFHIDPSVQIELYGYLNKHTDGMGESLIWLAELHAASVYGSVSFSGPPQVSGEPSGASSARPLSDGDARALASTPHGQSPEDEVLEKHSKDDSDSTFTDKYEVEPPIETAKGETSGSVSRRNEPLSSSAEAGNGSVTMKEISSDVTHDEHFMSHSNEANSDLNLAKTRNDDKDDTFSFLAEMAQKSKG